MRVASTLRACVLACGAQAQVQPLPLVPGPEQRAGALVYPTLSRDQYAPRAAFNGQEYFVVWEDEREAPGTTDLYGARVAADGRLLDPSPRRLVSGYSSRVSPTIAFGDGVYLVAWVSYANEWLYGLRLASDGTPLDSQERILRVGCDLGTPSAAFDGERFIVAFHQACHGSTDGLQAVWVQPSGELEQHQTVALDPASTDHRYPTVACRPAAAAGDCLVVWQSNTDGNWDITGRRYRGTSALDAAPFAVTAAAGTQTWSSVSAAPDGGYYVVWKDERTSPMTIRGAAVPAAGATTSSDGLVIATGTSSYGVHEPTVAAFGDRLLVGYRSHHRDGRYAVRISELACATVVPAPAEPQFGVSTSNQAWPHLVWGATSGLVVYTDARAGNSSASNVFANVVPPPGAELPDAGVALGASANRHGNAALATNGTVALVVWEDWRDGQSDLFMARFAADGAALDPEGRALAVDPSNQYRPTVTRLGEGWLVAWVDRNRPRPTVLARRVAASGELLGDAPVTLAPSSVGDQLRPAAATSGDTALVAFQDTRAGNVDVLAVRVASTGAVLDAPPLAVAVESYEERLPAARARPRASS